MKMLLAFLLCLASFSCNSLAEIHPVKPNLGIVDTPVNRPPCQPVTSVACSRHPGSIKIQVEELHLDIHRFFSGK